LEITKYPIGFFVRRYSIGPNERSIYKMLEYSASLTNDVLDPENNYLYINLDEPDGRIWFHFLRNN